ncbi:Asp-tRNA(Asn)/Glu-tRNA(Gln) amidotransferase subunit GatA [Gammaproteobacteria bacterium]|nr:Asp-tRNA(Asn)/Glu-tRNA(Gln) amidotransferase subunit GatA [Gammaproteobacteria bacterium]
MHQLNLQELSQHLKNGELSSVDITKAYIQRIEKHQDLNAFLYHDFDNALKNALHCDQNRKANINLPLYGIPVAHKDIFCTKNGPTTCGSLMLENYQGSYNATVVERFEAAGLFSLGKLNMDEFAMGSTNENSAFGEVLNPWNKAHCPGGSSGGSAAAVSARLVPASTGSDTGGSIRQPAAFTGITGIKPTYGRVSRYGMIAFASSLDQAGPLALNAYDAAMLLNVMCGQDKHDQTTSSVLTPDFTENINQDIKGLTIGIPEEFFSDGLSSECKKAVEAAIAVYESLGAIIKPIHLPNLNISIPTYYLLAPIEAASNLARYDGIHYGYRHDEITSLDSLYEMSREYGFGNEVKRRILIGTFASSSQYASTYYSKALAARDIIRRDYKKAFTEVDAILTPTTTSTAFELYNKNRAPSSLYLSDIYTVTVNLAGLPAISIPVGFGERNLPIGMQLISNRFNESTILQLAHAYQKVTTWHEQSPDID